MTVDICSNSRTSANYPMLIRSMFEDFESNFNFCIETNVKLVNIKANQSFFFIFSCFRCHPYEFGSSRHGQNGKEYFYGLVFDSMMTKL